MPLNALQLSTVVHALLTVIPTVMFLVSTTLCLYLSQFAIRRLPQLLTRQFQLFQHHLAQLTQLLLSPTAPCSRPADRDLHAVQRVGGTTGVLNTQIRMVWSHTVHQATVDHAVDALAIKDVDLAVKLLATNHAPQAARKNLLERESATPLPIALSMLACFHQTPHTMKVATVLSSLTAPTLLWLSPLTQLWLHPFPSLPFHPFPAAVLSATTHAMISVNSTSLLTTSLKSSSISKMILICSSANINNLPTLPHQAAALRLIRSTVKLLTSTVLWTTSLLPQLKILSKPSRKTVSVLETTGGWENKVNISLPSISPPLLGIDSTLA